MFARRIVTGVTLVFTMSLGAMALGAPAAVILAPGLKAVSAEVRLVDTESWIMGGSGLPIPPPSYLTDVSERFINPSTFPKFSGGQPLFTGQPEFAVDKTNPLFTPEGLYPDTGVKTLELDPSVAQGVSILNSTITQQTAAGNDLVVLGYSQSATINSLEMKALLADQAAGKPVPDADQLKFVMIGDPNNPDGGLLERFNLPDLGSGLPQLSIPSLGSTFSGATPADAPWDTAIYTGEYDGFADFPKYPIDFLADLNAVLGIAAVHDTYPTMTAAQLASAVALPTSADYTGHTQYFMIPTENLPLLDPLFASGNKTAIAIADLLQPDLKILVNLGYGNLGDGLDDGWDHGPANVATPFGLFPDVNFNDLMTDLANGAKQGIAAFEAEMASAPAAGVDAAGAGGDAGTSTAASFTDIVNAYSAALSSAYSLLLPLADIQNALSTTLPNYDLSLFTHYLDSGNLTDALGMPAAFNTGLQAVALGFDLDSVENAISGIKEAFSGI